MITHIYNLDTPNQIITGGHQYNADFRNELEAYSQITTTNLPQMYQHYTSWRYILAPVLELKNLRIFSSNSLVIFSDTAYIYHTLLALVSRLISHSYNVCIIHHFPWIGQHGFAAFWRKCCMKLYYHQMDEIIIPSPYTMDIARKYFPRTKLTYVPLPFEHLYKPSREYQEGYLLYVGTIEPRKGLLLLLQALTQLQKSFELHIVGKTVDEQYLSQLHKYISSHTFTGRICFDGILDKTQLEQCYQNAEVFVFPSQLEGFGIVLTEAMQHGLPIVAFNNSAMPYLIHDGINGYLAKNNDIQEYASKLLRVMGQSMTRKQLQQGMKDTINQFHTQADFQQAVLEFWKGLNN